MNDSDRVRSYAKNHYIMPARKSGAGTVTIRAGDVHKALKWDLKKVPQVCSALSTQKFLKIAGVELIEKLGPPSGQSTTVEFIFRILNEGNGADAQPKNKKQIANGAGLLELYGILADAYKQFGGGEEYLRREREGLRFPAEEYDQTDERKRA
jgi:hypothetical protein